MNGAENLGKDFATTAGHLRNAGAIDLADELLAAWQEHEQIFAEGNALQSDAGADRWERLREVERSVDASMSRVGRAVAAATAWLRAQGFDLRQGLM